MRTKIVFRAEYKNVVALTRQQKTWNKFVRQVFTSPVKTELTLLEQLHLSLDSTNGTYIFIYEIIYI